MPRFIKCVPVKSQKLVNKWSSFVAVYDISFLLIVLYISNAFSLLIWIVSDFSFEGLIKLTIRYEF